MTVDDATHKTNIASATPDDVTRTAGPGDPDATRAQSLSGMSVSRGLSESLPIVAGYLVEEQIGEGGMGVVYKAMQFKLNRVVALKMVIGGKTASAKDLIRFLAEAESVASIDHPYVISVYEFGDSEGRPYLAMEYLDGGSLSDRLRKGRLEPRIAAELLRKLAQAVQAAHDRQIVHRDLKPSNILFDGNGEPRVTDFGLAKRAGGSDLTGTVAIMGTAAYMAPEQARGESKFVGPAADVWALGVILYECLAGSRPFTGMNELEVLRSVAEREPTVIRGRIPSIAMDLDLIVQKCLAKKPEERYASAADLAEDLRRWLAGEPVSVKRAGPVERLVKWVRRNKVAAGIITSSLLGTALATTLAVYAYTQRQRANDEAAIAKAANDFVQTDILGQADTRQQADRKFKPDPDLKVRTALDRAAERVGTAFAGQPKTEHAIRRTIGNAYRSVGATSKAIEQLTRAEELADEQYGSGHALALSTRHDLAIAYHLAGRNTEAAARLEALQGPMLNAHGPDDLDTMGVEENLALCYADLGRKKEAIALLEQVRDRRERLRGPADARTLATIGNLATVYQDDDRVKDAVTLFERIVKAKLESADFGAEHPSTIAAQNNLAAAYLKDGRAAEVITLLQAVRTASTKALGAEHPETLKTLNNLAESLLQNHKADEAIAILKSVSDVQLASREFGPRHGDTARTLNNLAKAYVDAKRDYKTAIPIFEQARDALKGGIGVETIEFQLLNNLAEAYTTVRRIPDALRTYEELVGMAKANPEIGPAHVTTRDLLSSWTQMLLESGKFAEAVQPLRDLIAAEKRSPTPNRKLLASATVQLGNTLLNLGQAADAEAPLRESLAIRLEIQPKDWTTHNTRSLLGESLLKQKKLEEAGRELRQGYDNLIKVEILANYRTLRLGQALDRLIQHAEATNDANAKAKWQAEKAALSK